MEQQELLKLDLNPPIFTPGCVRMKLNPQQNCLEMTYPNIEGYGWGKESWLTNAAHFWNSNSKPRLLQGRTVEIHCPDFKPHERSSSQETFQQCPVLGYSWAEKSAQKKPSQSTNKDQ